MPSFLSFSVIWVVMTWRALQETQPDVDLGIATSRLQPLDASLWSLPLSVAAWVAVIVVAKIFVYGFFAVKVLRSESTSCKR